MRRHLLIGLAVMVVLAGCAGHAKTTRIADVSKADYYSTDEIRGLSKEGRDQYCRALESQILAYREEAKRLTASADSVAHASDSLKTVNAQFVTQIRDLDNEIRQLRLARRANTTYLVKEGDTLLTIASHVYQEGNRWKEIWEANKDLIPQIGPSDKVQPGIRLTIPAK